MVRTKADAYAKASVKAPRKHTALKNDSNKAPKGGIKSDKHSGGNPYCPRPIPSWQKPITSFFSKPGSSEKNDEKHTREADEAVPGCSYERLECNNEEEFESLNESDDTNEDMDSTHVNPDSTESVIEDYGCIPSSSENGKSVPKEEKGNGEPPNDDDDGGKPPNDNDDDGKPPSDNE